MDFDSLQQVLQDAGFTSYQSEFYIEAFLLGDATLTEIKDRTTIPQPRIYDTAQSLEDQGYVKLYEQDQRRVLVQNPDPLVQHLKTKSEAFDEAATKLEEEWRQPSLSEGRVSVFSQYHTLKREALSAIRDAERHIHIAASIEEFHSVQNALSSIDGENILVQVSLLADTVNSISIDDISINSDNLQFEIRERKSEAPFLVLLEGGESYIGIKNRRIGEYGMLVQDPILSSILIWYYDQLLWRDLPRVQTTDGVQDSSSYLSIRDCIRDISPLLREGQEIRAKVDGYLTQTGEEITIEGAIIDIISPGVSHHSEISASPIQPASLILQSENETYTVGGSGAFYEDIRGIRISLSTDNLQ